MHLIQRFLTIRRRVWMRGGLLACSILAALSTGLLPSLSVQPFVWAQTENPLQPSPAPEAGQTASPQQSPVLEIGNEIRNLLPPLGESDDIERGVVRFDGRELFFVANIVDDNDRILPGGAPRLNRANQIEQTLYQVARSAENPDEIEVEVRDSSEAPGVPVVYLGDDYLMSVTQADVQVNNHDDIWGLAYDIQERLRDGFARYQEERQSDYLVRQGIIAGSMLLVMLLTSWIVFRFQKRLQRERDRLSQLIDAVSHYQTAHLNPGDTTSRTAAIQQEMTHRHRRTTVDVGRRILQVVQIIIWGGGLFFVVGLFPYSRWLQPMLLEVMPLPLQIFALIWITQVLLRVAGGAVDRFFLAVQDRIMFSPESSQRVALRFSTFSRVTKGVLAVVLTGTAILIGLSIVGIQIAPLLAGAGILGLAISFGSQSLVKDVINGFFILLEDQYGVGDVVMIGDVAGLVENMNLRITQLRNEEGRLITIPNGSITVVQNLSKEWSRVDVKIEVAHSTNLNQALALVEQVAQEMSQDALWRPLILEPPSLLGVDALDYRGATIRIWIKTQPLKQWDVAREYRRRLKLAFDEAGIEIGVPQQLVSFKEALSLQGSLSQDRYANGTDSKKSPLQARGE